MSIKQSLDTYSLDELGFVGRGRSRHRPRNSPHLYGGDYPFVQTADVKSADLYITNYTQTYNEAGLAQSKLWDAGTLCITIAANIADTAILSFPACFPDSVIGFIPHKNKSNIKYIKYYFDLYQRVFKQISQGAAQDNLSAKKLLGLKIPAPPLPTQQKIAQILSAYDDLIENNLKRIKLLEETAQIIYEQWFVRMKFPNHETTPIDAETGLPEGWKAWNLNNLILIKHGYAYKGQFFNTERTSRILLTPGNFKIGGGLKLDKVKYYDEQAENPKAYILNKHDLLITMTDLSKMADTLGYPLLVPSSNGETYLHNQRLGKVLPKTEGFFPKYFYYMLFKDERYRGFVVGSASGATVKHTSPSKILAFKPKLPSADSNLIKQFDEYAKPIFNLIDHLLQQNRHLKEARDILLPRLMTGIIDVDKIKSHTLMHEKQLNLTP